MDFPDAGRRFCTHIATVAAAEIRRGDPVARSVAAWTAGEEAFRARRTPFLLYP